jgi:hypothetical protein
MMIKMHILALAMSGMLTSSLLSTYETWKAKQIQAWQDNKKESFAAQVTDLAEKAIENIENYHNTLSGKCNSLECVYKEEGLFKILSEIKKQEVLYAYNYLRELLHVQSAVEPQEADLQWLYDMQLIAQHYDKIERQRWYFPTLGHTQLLQEAQETLGMQEIILPAVTFNIFDGKAKYITKENYYELTLGQLPNLHERLFILYHELAHIFFKDDLDGTYLLSSYDSDIPQELFEDPALKHVADQVLLYTQYGIQALDNDTALGHEINSIVAQHKTFWDTSQLSDKVYRYLLFNKIIEARADLFACQKLYEQNRLAPILHIINQWATSGYRVVNDEDVHPSDFERALYMLGFLVDKGVDVNKAFKEWQAQGTCGNTLINFQRFFSQDSKGNADFKKAYADWSKTRQGYEYWKQALLAQWFAEKVISLAYRVFYLAEAVKNRLRSLEELSYHPIYQQEALYHYNFLRELLHLPQADSFIEIDHAWLDAQSYTFWKNSVRTDWLSQTLSLPTLELQVGLLLETLKESLNKLMISPHAPERQEKALYAYNFLQELRGRDPVMSFNAIDYAWLHEQTYTSFKALLEQDWSILGITHLSDKVDDIIERKLKLHLRHVENTVQHNSIFRESVLLACKLLKELVPALPEIHSWKEINSDFYDTARSLALSQESTLDRERKYDGKNTHSCTGHERDAYQLPVEYV